MALPTFSQIVSNMLAFLQVSRPDINTNTGTVVNDVVVSTVANELSPENTTSDTGVYPAIQYVQDVQAFVDNAATILPADLDAIGDNYGMTRNPGTAATGIITFRIRNYTTSSPIVSVPTGTVISTLATSSTPSTSFATTATVTFIPSLAPSYYNPVSGFYEQSTTIVAQTIGTVGNVSSNTITSLVSSAPGIDAVTNTGVTSGGTNIESNVQFAGRIQIKLEGNNVGTPNGIESLMETNPNVIQALIVGPNDPNPPSRNQYGGSVNVYIRGQIPVTVTETYTYSTTGPQQYILLNQPALSVGLVTGVVSGNPYTFVPGTDYVFELNPNSLFAGSVDAGSYIAFTALTYFTINTVGLSFTVTNVIDAIHLVVTTTAGMTAGDIIVQGLNSTTITSVTDMTHLTVASTAGWINGSAVDISVPQFVVSSLSGMNVGDTIKQSSFTTTVTAINATNNILTVTSTTGFVTGTAFFGGFKPDNNTVVTITYTYDSLIPTLQALFDNNSNHIVGSDILIVEAVEALINFTAGILIVPGYVPATVVSNVSTALSVYIDGLGLGADVVLSELVAIMQNVPGIAEVDLSSLILQSVENGVTTTIPPGQQISVGNEAYTVTNNLAITVES
jgi:uncharacterized phage protein gp47/JayE